jgi:hypothetical protein
MFFCFIFNFFRMHQKDNAICLIQYWLEPNGVMKEKGKL